jgi:hypothetical protein
VREVAESHRIRLLAATAMCAEIFLAHTGLDLWHIQLGAPVFSATVTYVLDGRQFVVIPAGGALFASSLPGE